MYTWRKCARLWLLFVLSSSHAASCLQTRHHRAHDVPSTAHGDKCLAVYQHAHASLPKHCGVGKLYDELGLALGVDPDPGSLHVDRLNMVTLTVCLRNGTSRLHDLRLHSALVGPEIIPLEFVVDPTESYMYAVFHARMQGSYILDVSVLMLEPSAGVVGEYAITGASNPASATYLHGFGHTESLIGYSTPSLECATAAQLYNSRSEFAVRGHSRALGTSWCRDFKTATSGYWSSTANAQHLNDADGTNFGWEWRPTHCQLNNHIGELMRCVDAPTRPLVFIGDSQMRFLELALKHLAVGERHPMATSYIAVSGEPLSAMLDVTSTALGSNATIISNLGLTHDIFHIDDFKNLTVCHGRLSLFRKVRCWAANRSQRLHSPGIQIGRCHGVVESVESKRFYSVVLVRWIP